MIRTSMMLSLLLLFLSACATSVESDRSDTIKKNAERSMEMLQEEERHR